MKHWSADDVRTALAAPASVLGSGIEFALPDDTNAWALTRHSAAIVCKLIVGLQCRSVLEFGAGQSSKAIAAALSASGGGKLTSVDHAPEYLGNTWQVVEQVSGVDSKLVVAPITKRLSARGLLNVYDGIRATLASRGPFDCLLIDAPPAQYGRDSPLHTAFEFLNDRAVIALDDSKRSREKATVRRWLSWYPGLTLIDDTCASERGMAVLFFNGSRQARFSVRSFLGTFDDWRRGL